MPEFKLVNMQGRLYDPVLCRFLSPDPYVQEPENSQSLNRYSYCLNNPMVYSDPSGESFVADAGTLAYYIRLSQRNGMNYFMYGGQRISIGEDGMLVSSNGYIYGTTIPYFGDLNNTAKIGGGIVSVTANFVSSSRGVFTDNIHAKEFGSLTPLTGVISARFVGYSVSFSQSNEDDNFPGGSYLRSPDVAVTFDPNADNLVNSKLSDYFRVIMTKVVAQGIRSINISCTTVHPSNASKTAHSVANGARAFDINYINEIHISPNNPYVDILQGIIRATPGYLENYGPLIINKINNGAIILAPWAREINGGHYDHIHISVPR